MKLSLTLSGSNDRTSQVISFLQKYSVYRSLIKRTVVCRYFPHTFGEYSEQLILECTKSANECKNWAKQIRGFQDLERCLPGCPKPGTNGQGVAQECRLQFDGCSPFGKTIQYLRQRYPGDYLFIIEEILFIRFYPFVLERNLRKEAMVEQCASECDRAAAELREYRDVMKSIGVRVEAREVEELDDEEVKADERSASKDKLGL